jgi:hypothetical protein
LSPFYLDELVRYPHIADCNFPALHSNRSRAARSYLLFSKTASRWVMFSYQTSQA